MSGLVDSNGRPVKAQTTDEQVIQALVSHKKKIEQMQIQMDTLNQNLIQLGLYTEYITEQVIVNFNKIDNHFAINGPRIELSMTEFPAWAEKRYNEMKELAKQMMAKELNADPTSKVNLEED